MSCHLPGSAGGNKGSGGSNNSEAARAKARRRLAQIHQYASAAPSAPPGQGPSSSGSAALEVVVLKELLSLDQGEDSDDEGGERQYDRWDSNTYSDARGLPATAEPVPGSEAGKPLAGQKTYQSSTMASSQRTTGGSGTERGRASSAAPFRLGGPAAPAPDPAAFAAKHRAINEQYLNPNR